MIKIDEYGLNKNINFLGDLKPTNNAIFNFHDFGYDRQILKELNDSNTELYINNKKYKFCRSFKANKEGINNIKLKFLVEIKDCSYMFFDCSELMSIDLSSFITNNLTNMRGMFYLCRSLKNINLSSFYTKNVTDMSNMFCGCGSLTNLDLSSFNTIYKFS